MTTYGAPRDFKLGNNMVRALPSLSTSNSILEVVVTAMYGDAAANAQTVTNLKRLFTGVPYSMWQTAKF